MFRAAAVAFLTKVLLSLKRCDDSLFHVRRCLEVLGQPSHTLHVLLVFLELQASPPLFMGWYVPVFVDNLLHSLSLLLAEIGQPGYVAQLVVVGSGQVFLLAPAARCSSRMR